MTHSRLKPGAAAAAASPPLAPAPGSTLLPPLPFPLPPLAGEEDGAAEVAMRLAVPWLGPGRLAGLEEWAAASLAAMPGPGRPGGQEALKAPAGEKDAAGPAEAATCHAAWEEDALAKAATCLGSLVAWALRR